MHKAQANLQKHKEARMKYIGVPRSCGGTLRWFCAQPSTLVAATQRHSFSNAYGGVKGKPTFQLVASPLVVFPATNPTSVITDAVGYLLPYNRDLDQSVQYRRSSSENPREEIKNIAEWTRAFIVFAAYRQSENPQFCLPSSVNYMDLITSMDERDEPWLIYGENFRRYASCKPLDTAIWCRVHERSYQNAKPRLPVSARLGIPSTSKPIPRGSCFSRGEPNWTRDHRCKRSSNQPFRTRAAATAAPGEVCYNWNRGFCLNGDNCPRRHVCSECYANGLRVTIHNFKNHPKVQYKVNGDKNSTRA